MKSKNIFSRLLIFQLISALLLCVISPAFCGETTDTLGKKNSLKFVQISDVHLDLRQNHTSSKRLFKYSRQLLLDAINQVNAFKDIDFVIFTGDVINKPYQPYLIQFLETADQLRVPWYIACGNHDVGINPKLTKSKFLQIVAEYNIYIPDHHFYYSFVPKKGFAVIVMDGVIDSIQTGQGFFPKEELDWLEGQLQQYHDSIVVICQHHALIEPYDEEYHRVKNADEYLNILKKYHNVVAVLSGHYHAARIIHANNIIYACAPSLIQYPNAFRTITITNDNGKLSLCFDFRETRLKKLQQKSLSRTNSPEKFAGTTKDQNACFTVSLLDNH